jgi:hypothetical protein
MCGRPFESVFDFPRVRVISVRRLPLPEAIDSLSDEAYRRGRARGDPSRAAREGSVNLTPEIEHACELAVVRAYFDKLDRLVQQVIAPNELLPPWKADSYFRSTYPLPGTRLWLAIDESEEQNGEYRAATLDVLSEGPNMGSAGGPTLQVLGSLVRIEYEGVLDSRS